MRNLKNIVSLFMIVVMLLSSLSIATTEVDAKVNPYITYKSVYIIKGKTFKVQIKYKKKGAKVKWSSSNKKVATVKAGVIKGVGPGTCIITAKYNKKKYTCKVEVQRDLTVREKIFEAVTLNMINLKLDVQKITYTDLAEPVYSNKKSRFRLNVYNTKKSVKWKSSNENVATVSSKGLITAKKQGKCKITTIVAGKKLICSVRITDLKDEVEILNQEIKFSILKRLNIDRIKAKAKPLKMLEPLCEIADIRAKDISVKWAHSRPNGKSFSSVYNIVGFEKGKVIGENLAYTEDKPANVNDFVKYAYKHLYSEKAHRDNMLSRKYKCVGIGYYNAGYSIGDFGEIMIKSYWTQELYTK